MEALSNCLLPRLPPLPFFHNLLHQIQEEAVGPSASAAAGAEGGVEGDGEGDGSAEDDSDAAVARMPVDSARVLYCERFLELLIDLLSQLPTRRCAAVQGHPSLCTNQSWHQRLCDATLASLSL